MPRIASVILMLICTFPEASFAQSTGLHTILVNADSKSDQDTLTQAEANSIIPKKIFARHLEGFLTCYYDTLKKEDSLVFLQEIPGEAYTVSEVKFASVLGASATLPTEQKNKNENERPVETAYADVEREILALENRGYPFASARAVPSDLSLPKITLEITLDKGPLIQMDSVVIKGEQVVDPLVMENYLGLKRGEPYEERKIKNIENLINNLPYLSLEKAPQLLFTEDGAQVWLYLKKKPANQFSGIVGFQPGEATGKIILTGEITLKLHNQLKKGEQFQFEWKQVRPQSQNLLLGFDYPYLFKSSFGVGGNLHIDKRDSTFQTTVLRGGIRQNFSGQNSITATYTYDVSNALRNAINLGKTTSRYYGIGANFERLDYRLNPKAGAFIQCNLAVGSKTATATELENPSPETAPKESTNVQTKNELKAGVYMPFGKRSTAHIRTQAGLLRGAPLYINEFFRLGGIHSIRGFDEESVFASEFAIVSAEYRFLLDRDSHLKVFYDFGYAEGKTDELFTSDLLQGFGLGASLLLNNGYFAINYALGSLSDNPILIRNGKIHFSFTSVF